MRISVKLMANSYSYHNNYGESILLHPKFRDAVICVVSDRAYPNDRPRCLILRGNSAPKRYRLRSRHYLLRGGCPKLPKHSRLHARSPSKCARGPVHPPRLPHGLRPHNLVSLPDNVFFFAQLRSTGPRSLLPRPGELRLWLPFAPYGPGCRPPRIEIHLVWHLLHRGARRNCHWLRVRNTGQ